MTDSGSPLLAGRDLTKIFPGVVANEGVDLDLWPGRIHALIGENGAGKSTLVSMLYGATRPDRGHLEWNGKRLAPTDSQEMRQRGIGFVPQHVTLVEPFTVWENLALNEGLAPWSNPARAANLRSRAEALNATYALDLEFDAKVSSLALGKRQNVELLKALLANPRLLILDEPTAILTPGEVERLFAFLRQLRDGGAAVLIIAHKLSEVLALSDEITILRGGRKIAHRLREATHAEELAALMIGESAARPSAEEGSGPPPAPEPLPLRPVVWLQKVGLKGSGARPALDSVSFQVFAGEIFGIAGIDGNGQRELFEVLTGDCRPTSGMFEVLENDNLPALSVRQRNALGLRRISEDRHHDGLALELPIRDNLVMQYASAAPYSKRGWLRRRIWRQEGERLKERFRIAAADLAHPVRTLSGGNQQKVILARELREPAKLLVVAQPTRGLDFNAARFVESQLRAATQAGCAVVLISGDLDELLSLSHRIGVLHRGAWMGVSPNDTNARRRIGRMMAGTPWSAEGGDA